MNTPDSLYESLTRSPDDWPTRAVLADWYEEHGHQRITDCIRWMHTHKKRPYRSAGGNFCWFNVKRVTSTSDPESDIPESVYLLLKQQETIQLVFRTYSSLRAADEDFYAAWQAAKDQGWTGNE